MVSSYGFGIRLMSMSARGQIEGDELALVVLFWLLPKEALEGVHDHGKRLDCHHER